MPSCGTCNANGLECEGYLLQWPGLASRGKFVGKSVPVSATSEKRRRSRRVAALLDKTSHPRIAIGDRDNTNNAEAEENMPCNVPVPTKPEVESNSTPEPTASLLEDDFPLDATITDLNIDPDLLLGTVPLDLGSIESEMTLGPNLDVLNIPGELKFILQYHICEVIPKLCVDNFCLQNPYREYIFPLAIEIPSLLYACAALAACHYNIRLGTSQFQSEFLRFKGKAMKRLQEDLYSQTRATHPGTLATILMLCLSDICQGGISDFESHFLGAKKLIEMRSETTPRCFVEQYLMWLDIMAAASHSRKPVFSSHDIQTTLGSDDFGWSFDVFPCPSDQFQIICEIISLYKNQPEPECPSLEVLDQVQQIKQKLLQGPIHSNRDQNWLHLTEAYRFSIILYLLRLFGCEIDEYEVDWLVSSVIYHARSTPPASGYSDQLLWPLFHAGLEITDAKRQDWMRERAQCMQWSGGFGNVKIALDILEHVWRGDRPSSYLNLMLGWGNGNVLLI
ncbi:uncharacterized protein N7511_008556 [Penicillium nucicola]|uniref:uncharacterized protein n=1 Tax=Penicillium nucicola TaxID=1850975 RepID=UPI002544D4F6|nr:uncharacterized protein N7511_008556 [Penicillium nucicola]KAJ5746860.1 hypothetical protein N7511_008556 [Penicillium nucicola]